MVSLVLLIKEAVLPNLFEILPKFLTNQNFSGCTCTPCTSSSYTTVVGYQCENSCVVTDISTDAQ